MTDTETETDRDKRPWFYVIVSGGLLLSAVLWWVNHVPAPDFAEVSGVVTLDGKPLDEVEVRFVPDIAAGGSGPASVSFTDSAGVYKLRCDKYRAAGAVIGVHRVVIFDPSTLPAITSLLTESAAPVANATTQRKKSRVPHKYEDVSTTPLGNVEVRPGRQEMNFKLESGRK